MQSPTTTEEENVFTNIANAYLDKREKVTNEKIKVFTIFVWIAVLFCLSCLFLCWFGVKALIDQNENYKYFIVHEMEMSEKRDIREIERARIDSSDHALRVEDHVNYKKEIKTYRALPDHKGE